MRRAGEVNRVRWPKEGGEQGETNQAPELLEQGGEGRRSGEGSCSRPRAPRRGSRASLRKRIRGCGSKSTKGRCRGTSWG
ncbi:hypothetical protein GQ55_9G277800 [Panicum hallii var. hallii]|uniref:Uncharacterized protein n=1 Tax=Panicum hallii var. hallii TaxID=1504633 RepID=A0A2T7C7G4_9POAL|nr:hypothetical protein GQ55_9G277800 [Panicum hallii var. hallii]